MPLELKPAAEKDVELVFQWANDPLARQLSFSSENIAFESHAEWFKKKLQKKDCIFLILYSDGIPAGQIRYDKTGDEYLISFSISKEMRGKGLGAAILKMGETYLRKSKITKPLVLLGVVKKQNLPSISSFKKNEYSASEADPVLYPDSFIFKKLIAV